MNTGSIIEFDSVSKNFGDKHGVKAVRDVSFSIRPGETVAIMGPSGSGKSTILNLAAGLDTPSSGVIEIQGTDLSGLNDKQLTRLRRKQIGLIFQSFNLLPTLTAVENVSLPLRLQGVSQKAAEKRALEMLEIVGLEDRGSHLPDEMSGGECQRVAIARAMVAQPELLLADEPTGNLDSKTGMEVLEKVVNLNEEFGTTIVLVTHDRSAAEHCGRIMTLNDGKIESLETAS